MDTKIYVKIPRKEITFLTKIIEGYDNLGVVTTLDAQQGLVMVQVTPDTILAVKEILRKIPEIEEMVEE